MKTIKIGDRVVRSKGDYVVGRTGTVIDEKFHRRQVRWDKDNTTWVSVDALELESIPYYIQRFTSADRNPKTGRMPYPKYHRK